MYISRVLTSLLLLSVYGCTINEMINDGKFAKLFAKWLSRVNIPEKCNLKPEAILAKYVPKNDKDDIEFTEACGAMKLDMESQSFTLRIDNSGLGAYKDYDSRKIKEGFYGALIGFYEAIKEPLTNDDILRFAEIPLGLAEGTLTVEATGTPIEKNEYFGGAVVSYPIVGDVPATGSKLYVKKDGDLYEIAIATEQQMKRMIDLNYEMSELIYLIKAPARFLALDNPASGDGLELKTSPYPNIVINKLVGGAPIKLKLAVVDKLVVIECTGNIELYVSKAEAEEWVNDLKADLPIPDDVSAICVLSNKRYECKGPGRMIL